MPEPSTPRPARLPAPADERSGSRRPAAGARAPSPSARDKPHVTRAGLVERIAARAQLTKTRAEELLDVVLGSMVHALDRNEGVEIRGFGSFTVRQYRAYRGRNPKTGDEVRVAPKRLPYFRAGKELRELLNAEPPQRTEAEAREPAQAPSALSVDVELPAARPRVKPVRARPIDQEDVI